MSPPQVSLEVVPDIPVRVLGAIRVSKERDEMVAPEVQQRAITDYCRPRGYVIVGWVEGPDDSGSRADSKWWAKLDGMIDKVESGAVDGIVVWKFSRTARNRLKWAIALDRIETAGGRMESATEQIDATTSTGRFTRGMLAELNAFEAERIGEVWKEVQANRVANGYTHNGKARFGYVYDRGLKLHQQDPGTAAVLAELYRRFTAGESCYGLATDLNRRAIKTTAGGLWTDGTLRRALESGFGAGLVKYNGKLYPGKHEPVIDPGEWQAYQDCRIRRRKFAPRSGDSPYLLSGLIRCSCGSAMPGGTFGTGRHPKYRCERRRATGGAGCPAGYVAAAYMHDKVYAWLVDLAEEIDEAAAGAKLVDDAAETRKRDADRLAREVARLEAAAVRVIEKEALDVEADPAVYAQARSNLQQQLAVARAAAAEAAVVARGLERGVEQLVRPLVEDWDTLLVAGRRNILRSLIAHVEVWPAPPGRPRDPRKVVVVPQWAI